ncbi:MAG: undecaprenyl-diphosphate phosphatase [Alphaproteobacteria bacterium]|nr:undecaprenyl-diphosphate phosphatase [Alphaproteobacteria bacterium]
MSSITAGYAVLLGVVEGLTEFIPVSSTGHLILVTDLLKLNNPTSHVFEIAIQLGAICAVLWAYMQKIWHVSVSITKESASRMFVRNLLLAFIPSVVFGLIFHDFIEEKLFNPTVVSISLIIGGLIIIFIERLKMNPLFYTVESVSWKKSMGIGFCQVLAMIPGTSRSGATIMGALVMGLDRKAATEFSFFLAVPTMLAATTLDMYKSRHELTADSLEMIGIGFVTAFIAALFVVKALIRFVSTRGFTPFAYYRIVLGLLMLGLIYGKTLF